MKARTLFALAALSLISAYSFAKPYVVSCTGERKTYEGEGSSEKVTDRRPTTFSYTVDPVAKTAIGQIIRYPLPVTENGGAMMASKLLNIEGSPTLVSFDWMRISETTIAGTETIAPISRASKSRIVSSGLCKILNK
jgi:hypothetical protein